MYRTRVGVLRGGPSEEYEVSLKSGTTVLEHLSKDRYETLDIFIDKNNVWHLHGRPITIGRVLGQIDVAFIALHGRFGEDGGVQRILECHRVPFTGSDAFASALAMNKENAKNKVAAATIRTPVGRVIQKTSYSEHDVRLLCNDMGLPLVVKPVASGSSLGVSIVRTVDECIAGIERAFSFGNAVLIEEYIEGVEATCGVIEHFRDKDVYALPPVEIIPNSDKSFFDYEAKYAGASLEICPARFANDTKKEIERCAILVHRLLGLRHYSRSDFIVSQKGIYFLEANTLPGLTEASLLPKAVNAVGCSLPSFLDHLICLAKGRKEDIARC